MSENTKHMDEQKARIERLENAGNAMERLIRRVWKKPLKEVEGWTAAKEAKL